MKKIDLNADLGESYGPYQMGMDEEIIPLITSANVGCGFHGGDPIVMDQTVSLCVKNNVAVGAHPGLPDLMGFGRRTMSVSPAEVKAMIKYQVGALWAFCQSHGTLLQHVKAHGALYNMAAKDYAIARAMAEAIVEIDKKVILLGLSGSQMIQAAKDVGMPYRNEVFADRAYQADGSLVARGTPGAMIHDETICVNRIVKMIHEHKVTALTGEEIDIHPESICVHGDNPQAVAFVKCIRKGLYENDVKLNNMM